MSALVFERFLSTPAMVEAFGQDALLGGMLDFEAALARAQAAEGLIPPAAAETIAAACRIERIDGDAIVAASGRAGSLAIPLVKALTAAVAKDDAEAAGYVHWGSTSQDLIDTTMVLATKRALVLIHADLGQLTATLLELADTHRDTPILARTLMQPAQVISVGFKFAGWIAPLARAERRLRAAGEAALQLQLGGAVGTLSVMGEKGAAVARRVAAQLALSLPPSAWHTQRDAWVALGCEVGVLCGSLGKIAKDISLLAQGEIGELAEPSGGGRGGSSAMPHKRNPVASMLAMAAATRAPHHVAALLAAMPQEHERGLGNWQAELAEWPGLFTSAHGALAALAEAAAGLSVDGARMRQNIDALQGLVFAESVSMLLAEQIGKSRAHSLVEAWSKRVIAEKRHLRDVTLDGLRADAELAAAVPAAAVEALFDSDQVARRAGVLAGPLLGALRAQHRAAAAPSP